ncbi:cortical cell-delineating protein [Aegilops tauschii subsp. strangulata]|uniref:Bifunctional inhibitor/plant lipid transfer protein/seed storage helical domain-containing protein n=1 Tax=Aegilops tauschii subsp. strangulata TaxID=200361 RepID=A0A453T0K9_AEGTS|nr:cortical cell-delineating protein [Aegilops tauschii subsp. strangulata]
MAPSKLALFLALNLALLAATQGCGSYCPPDVPTPPIRPPPVVPSTGGGSCPINTLKLGVCTDVLNLLKLRIGVPENEQCCPLLGGLADLDAAVCLCTAIRANILGIQLNVPIDLTLLLNQCGKKCPSDFTCPI